MKALTWVHCIYDSFFQMVPIKEMTDCLKVVREMAILKPKAWVRLKRGLFKDDLAQVDYVETAQNAVHLKLIPRIDYSRPRGVLRTSQSVNKLCFKYNFYFILYLKVPS